MLLGHLGKDIGQLSCDLSGGVQFSKIVKAIFAGPKGPYSIVYLDKPQWKCAWSAPIDGGPKIRCPGAMQTFPYQEKIRAKGKK